MTKSMWTRRSLRHCNGLMAPFPPMAEDAAIPTRHRMGLEGGGCLYAAGRFVGCMALAAAHLKASGMEITVVGPGREKLPN